MSLNKFFYCQSTLAKFENCGYSKPFLDPFANWLVKQHFTKSCSRKDSRNIVHFSYFLQKAEDVGFYDLSKHMDALCLGIFHNVPVNNGNIYRLLLATQKSISARLLKLRWNFRTEKKIP